MCVSEKLEKFILNVNVQYVMWFYVQFSFEKRIIVANKIDENDLNEPLK